MKVYGHADGPTRLGGVAADAAASAGLRVAPPPKVRMSQESGRVALQEYIAAAEFRYHRRIVDEEEVPFWITDDLTSRPVVQVRLADAGDLFMTWTWAGGARGFGTGHGPADEVDRAVRALAAALPGPGTAAEGMRHAFASGAMTDPQQRARTRTGVGRGDVAGGTDGTDTTGVGAARAVRWYGSSRLPGSPRSPGSCSPSTPRATYG